MTKTALIGVDWGTTNARAFRYDHGGRVVESRHAEIGLLRVSSGVWETTFRKHFGDWYEISPSSPVVLCGMVGSQQGWSEAPYVECPVDIESLAIRLHQIPQSPYRIVPGIQTSDSSGVPDVMRGEETQLAGLDVSARQMVCLPGTHSKWVQIEHQKVTGFQTFMTGEVFNLLSQHSILARTQGQAEPCEVVFMRGLDDSARDGGLLHQLFGIRGLRLFKKLAGTSQADYLSGLLIGNEVRSVTGQILINQPVTLIGSKVLTARYQTALQHFGHTVEVIDGELTAARGLWRIAVQAGMIASA